MKRINFWALLAAGLIGLQVAAFAQDEAKKPDAAQKQEQEELFKKLDKNADGKLTPDEIPEEQGRFFDRLVRLGDKDDNGELTKAEFDAAIQRSDAPVQGGGENRGGPGGAGGRPMLDFKQMLERLDKNKDGKLSKDEVPEDGPGRFLREIMERQKKDVLTAEDFEQMRQRMGAGVAGAPGGRPGAGAFVPGEFFKRLDKNNDGKLQKDELPEGLRERLGKVLENLGKNELSQEEFGQAMAALGPQGGAPGARGPGGTPNESPEDRFKRMDANGDGKVTLDEIPEQFRDRAKPMFDRVKKDVLTLDDVRAFAQAREGERRQEADRKPDGDRRPEAARDDARKPAEPGRDGARRPDADRKPDGDRRPDGDRDEGRKPDEPRRDGGRGPDGQRPPEGRRQDGQPPRDGDRRPEGEGRRGPLPRFFELLDSNRDGKLSKDELNRLKEVFAELDRNKDGQLDPSELFGPPQQGPQDGRGPQGGRGPEGRGPRDGDRWPDGDRRPDGDRPPEGRRPDGQPPRDGGGRPDGDRPRDGERRPEGDRPRDGERRPEADRPRDGERRPDPRPEGRPPRREEEGKPRE